MGKGRSVGALSKIKILIRLELGEKDAHGDTYLMEIEDCILDISWNARNMFE